jgi:hypothetical protein
MQIQKGEQLVELQQEHVRIVGWHRQQRFYKLAQLLFAVARLRLQAGKQMQMQRCEQLVELQQEHVNTWLAQTAAIAQAARCKLRPVARLGLQQHHRHKY